MSATTQHRLRVEPEIVQRYPAYRATVIYARGLDNGPSDRNTQAALQASVDRARATFGQSQAAANPHIAAWREAFSSFGAKPSRYPSSAEALLARALGRGELPWVNRLVDLYNAVSVSRVLPIGGEDWEQLQGDGVLRFARGDERFESLNGDADEVSTPRAGEVIWSDDAGVTCRRWNWRQCRRTQLTKATSSAYFLLEAIGSYPDAELEGAATELGEGLRELCPAVELEVERLPGR